MKKTFILLLLILVSFILLSQKNVVENITVDWWVVPVFAVDKTGNSIVDMTEKDIDLIVDKKMIKNFILYKRTFNAERKISVNEKNIPSKRRKIVFLIFDIAFSTKDNLIRATEIGKDLVKKSDSSTKFVLMVLNPFGGLKYIYGPTNKKNVLTDLIKNKVKMLPRARDPLLSIKLATDAQVTGNSKRRGGGAKYSSSEIDFLREEISAGLKNTTNNFFFSFESLYYSLNQIKANKFIYLFSEGISLYARKMIRHVEGEYYNLLKKSAEFIGKSGAVVFIIDPTSLGSDDIPIRSGKDSLKYLAYESGGKYLRGDKISVSEKLEKMNRAYYEIAFADDSLSEKKIKNVLIRTKRKGLKIHTLRNLEKKKKYLKMNKIEKEVLAINLITKNLYFDPPLEIKMLKTAKVKRESDKITYTVKLPSNFKGKNIDIFRVWIDNKENGKTVVESGKLLTIETAESIRVKRKGSAYGKIVLVNRDENVALVQGEFETDIKLNAFIKKQKKGFEKNLDRMSEKEIIELKGLIKGTDEYCKKLEKSVFHFICKEEVVEHVKDIGKLRKRKEMKVDPRTGALTTRMIYAKNDGSVFNKRIRKFVFDYQLIQEGDRIREQRTLISKIKNKHEMGSILNIESFISKKIVLIPSALLNSLNHHKYYYRFVKHEKIKGIKSAVIEIFPKDPQKAGSIYGKAWVDINDFSVIRIVVNPISIGGFKDIFIVSSKINSLIDLKCRIDFNKKWNGIRFPTMVKIIEKHIGGPVLKNVLRKKIWERNKTIYTYSDYKFFNVETEVKIKK